MADNDQQRFAEVIRQTIEAHRAATRGDADAISGIIQAVEAMELHFRESAERARKQIERGAHLTRHRITL